MKQSWYALIDCNNFYVSCERVFAPYYKDRPVIVLSNNDGCVISRSNEAKALNIKMGVPFFKIQHFCKNHDIKIFSSNYALYGDISQRVMTILSSLVKNIEIYSIDEAFIHFTTNKNDTPITSAQLWRNMILQCTSIPVSIGIARTKTLAKLANYHAKQQQQAYCWLENETIENKYLHKTPVIHIWGIGKKWQVNLALCHINTAYDLKQANTALLRKRFNVIMERTQRELNGTPCLQIEDTALTKQNMISSRSFSRPVSQLAHLNIAISQHVAQLSYKLRQQNQKAQYICVFIKTNAFSQHIPYLKNQQGLLLPQATNLTSILLKHAKLLLKQIYQSGIAYQKAGVIVGELQTIQQQQFDLFTLDHMQNKKQRQFVAAMDNINQHFGKHTITYAAEYRHNKHDWQMRRQFLSAAYTTNWSELKRIK